jgi:hypothetical protein
MTGMQTMIGKKEKCKHANCAGNHEKSKNETRHAFYYF